MAHHYIVRKTENGEPQQYALKNWIRLNLDNLPLGFDPDNQTTSQLKGRLRQLQWQTRQTVNEVFMICPDENGSFDYADSLIENIREEEEQNLTENDEANELTFSLEKDLQAALRKNIESLETGLVIIDNGRERNTVAGRIDITAQDNKSNKVIIELKAIDAKSEVIAQTLAYMEAVKNEDKCNVRGIIVASGFSERVKLASRQIPNLKLIEYKFQFNFHEEV